ncbi:MAG: hypothetical protein JW955_21890 [Sedimentisphaerales bacterium]|nr:hypothetical protein [Sedimentisphaerales bacterium]
MTDVDFLNATLLLYRKDIGQACFIEYEYGGFTALHVWIAFKILSRFGIIPAGR